MCDCSVDSIPPTRLPARAAETLWQSTVKEPVFIVAVLFAYLYFVLKCGPAFMKNRQPYKLRSLMLVYNAFQVLFNCFMVYKVRSIRMPEATVNHSYTTQSTVRQRHLLQQQNRQQLDVRDQR